ncbi:MAG TPA: FG-GAP-like repeat-containing protein, partial [Candidatus Eisenbacteria bacterium]|nr:FG-GAP-like repeat-containing protein [Candidatus Eisenbacteria bacterium]
NGGATEIGRALALARVPFVPYSEEDNPHRWTQLSLILLGDPSLKFSTTVPKVLNVSHASTFTLGTDTFAVSVTQNGQPLANARVTLTKDGDEYAMGTTNLFGQAVIPFRPDLTGTFCVGVTATGYLPKLTNATVVTPSGKAYVFASTHTLSDGTTGSMNGNGDGRLDAGETVEVRFGIKNQGSLTASGVTASLSSTDPYLTILDATSAFANVPPGGTISASDPMLIRVSRSAPDRYEAHGTLTINGTNGPFVEDVVFWVHAPVIEYYAQTVDGIIQPNVDLILRPTLRNAGAGRLRSASLRLRSQDPTVILSDTVVALGNVLPGAIATHATDTFRIRFTNLSGPHPVTLAVVDAYGQVFSRKIDVFAPGTASGLAGSATSSSVTLTWAKVPDADLWGYTIYRSPTPNGTFTRINPWTVLRTSLFEDSGLPPMTSYSYKVAAVDSSGNASSLSSVTTVTTKLPLHAGWPVDTGASTPAGVCLTDLNGDGDLEVLGGGLEVLALAPDGGDFYNGDQNALTKGPITNVQGAFWSTPAVGDLKGDGNLAVAAIGFNDLKLHVVTPQGTQLPGWPKTINIPAINEYSNPVGAVCLGDIDADGELEIFATVGKIIFGWRANGAEIRDGDANSATNGVFAVTGTLFSYGTPSVANVDADPYRELIAGMRDGKLYVYRHDGSVYPGFPWDAGGEITTSPAVGDLNLDGRMEIVFGSSNHLLHALHTDLTQSTGFPKPVPLAEDWDSSPALGDVNGDGAPDVAIGSSDSCLYVLNGMNGNVISGFPADLGTTTRSSPAIADLDGNGSLDIVIGDSKGRLHGYDNAGCVLLGFPVQTGNKIENGPAVGDVDGDGLTEVVVQSLDQRIYVWDTPWTFNPVRAPWPMFKGNPRHTGALGDPAF